jgi:hypothetical protein
MAASSSQTVTPSGGSTSVTYAGQTATVTVPAGALSSSATIHLTLYAASSLPVTFSHARRAQSVPSGATALAGLIVDDGGVALTKPLQVAFTGTGIAAPAAGTSVLLSGYNANTWDDVSTMTYAAGAFTETTDPHYPGITLAAATNYVLYSVPTSAVATPTATVTVSGPASVGTSGQATYTASETTANGFPFFGHTFTYAVSAAALGTIGASTGVLTVGAGGIGNVTATDAAVSSFSGALSVSAVSARPGTAGLTESYTGTLNEVDANDVISSAPVTNSTSAHATVSVSAAAANDNSGNVVFTANESDAAALSTVTAATTSTVAYQTQGATVGVRALKTVAVESTGVTYEHDYGANDGLLTVLPETTGTFSNDAGEEYKETDPGVGISGTGSQEVTTDRVVAANGTYNATIQEPNVYTGTPATDTATENADFSGVLTLNSVDPGNYTIDFAAPASGQITVTFLDPNLSVDNPFTVPSWLPPGTTQPSTETDTITAGATLDGSCAPAAGFSGTANLVEQQLTVVDVVDGTLETRTTKSYDVNGIGTVCTVVNDAISTFYDYSGQEGPYLIFFANSATQPALSTTVSETLSLQTSNAAHIASVSRSTQSLGVQATLPAATIATRVAHLARARIESEIQTLRRTNARALRGGEAK